MGQYNPDNPTDIINFVKAGGLDPYEIAAICHDPKCRAQLNEAVQVLYNTTFPNIGYVPNNETEVQNIALRALYERYSSVTTPVLYGQSLYTLECTGSGLPIKYAQYIATRAAHAISTIPVGRGSVLLTHPDASKTQKAFGLFKFCSMYTGWLRSVCSLSAASHTYVIPYDQQLEHLTFPLFARPCPVRPRHGFVESSTVFNMAQLQNLFGAARLKDPHAEMMLMPRLSGEYSIVYTPGTLSLGAGHAGATSGDRTMTVPLNGIAPLSTTERAALWITETPYIEIVHHTETGHEIVQIRNGPKVPEFQKDYVPRDMHIRRFIMADSGTSLTEYEHMIENALPNTVILAPNLGITSHFAVHAYQHHMPFITDPILCDRIASGHIDQIYANTDVDTGNRKYLAERLRYYLQQPLTEFLQHDWTKNRLVGISALAELSLTVGHVSLLWSPNNDTLNNLVALSLAAFLATYITALIGEDRHFLRMFATPQHQPEISFKFMTRKQLLSENARNIVYTNLLKVPTARLLHYVPTVLTDFCKPVWTNAIGGAKWAHSAMSILKLVHTVNQFLAKPSANRWGTVMTNWHACINEQHNNGPIMTKFVPYESYHDAATNPAENLLKPRVTQQLFYLHKEELI